jgi:homeodomain-containing protein
VDRYAECGLEGLTDRARRPHRYAHQLPEQVEAVIVAAKREKPSWGARKIRERLLRRLPSEVKVPACSTIHTILDRHGLVARARRSRTHRDGTPLSVGLHPNALWCTHYKGEFRLGMDVTGTLFTCVIDEIVTKAKHEPYALFTDGGFWRISQLVAADKPDHKTADKKGEE